MSKLLAVIILIVTLTGCGGACAYYTAPWCPGHHQVLPDPTDLTDK